LDYEETLLMRADSTVTLRGEDGGDGFQIINTDAEGDEGVPIAIEGLDSEPFDGQYIQLDVVSVRPIP
jgi:hypothetical protein